MGFAVFLFGAYLGFTLTVSGQESWTVWLAGRMAWPLVLSLLATGAVMMLGRQAGYWHPEALVGAELLLLSLAALDHIGSNRTSDWSLPASGQSAGLIGWGAGNLLTSLLGQLPAAFAAGLLALASIYLLIRHTPLIYLFGYIGQLRRELAEPVAESAAPHSLDPEEFSDADDFETAQSPPNPENGAELQPTAFLDDTLSDQLSPELTEHKDLGRPIRSELPVAAAAPSKRKPNSGRAAELRLKRLRSEEELPSAELLEDDDGQLAWDIEGMGETIQETLWDFDIPVEVVNVESGPTVTQFGVQPLYIERAGQRRKVRVSRIVSAADDLALALAAPAVRIEAPVPGQPYVGIEVPNPEKSMVGLRGILQSKQVTRQGGRLPLALGRDTSGRPIVTDLARAPHLLIAGATGSGKSACINGVIVSLLMYHGPESLRFIMVDPKLVELPGYNRIPHMIGKVITDLEDVHGALTWLLLQMDDRYVLFRENKVRDIESYNKLARRRKKLEPLHHIVLVVDELADLMMTAPEEVEKQLVRLAQMARATGIHLVLATQRPSTDVVTGLIKANFPSRIAFAVTSQVDSRVILDTPGAEKLLGQGDMLFMRPDKAKIERVQGSYVNDSEIKRVVDWWQERDLLENPGGPAAKVAPWIGLLDRLDDEEELLAEAIDAIRGEKTISASFVQQELKIGYPRAARLVKLLESRGLVSTEPAGGQRRTVLMKAGATSGEESEPLERA
jgi:S-DNA-T family DNA segregation ATPase FtsK/SpoIIIE